MHNPAIIGSGAALPAQIRTNDDPIFDWLKKNVPNYEKLFQGYSVRHVLGPEETALDILVPASAKAMQNAGVQPMDIDLVCGCVSVSEFIVPSGLARLHKELGLRRDAAIWPISNDFNNFTCAMLTVDGLIRAGRIKTALVGCGCNWTKHVDYHTPESASAGDAAGAVIVSASEDDDAFRVVDAAWVVDSSAYGTMYMLGDPVEIEGRQLWTDPMFHITQAGFEDFQKFGASAPPQAAIAVLERNGVQGADVTLLMHQSSSVLTDAWAKAIGAGQVIETLATYANIVSATLPVNFAEYYHTIQKEWVVMLEIGVEMQTSAMLLHRGSY